MAIADSNRKQRILEATLAVLCESGHGGLTLRAIAQAAGVSLGAVTYHYPDRDSLLSAAFRFFVEGNIDRFRSYFTGVTSLSTARDGLVAMLMDASEDRRVTVLGAELYAISLRRPRHRLLLDYWTRECRAIIGSYFDEPTTLMLDALYEGVLLHKSMHLGEYSEQSIRGAIERLTPPESFNRAC